MVVCPVALFVASGCAGTLDRAHASVRAVRPVLGSEPARTVPWSDLPPSRACEEGRPLTFCSMSLAFAAQRDALARLGVVTEEDARSVGEALFGDASSYAAAFVVPSRDLIVVRASAEHDLHLLAHELGHIASYRAGYDRLSSRALSLRADGALDPAWIDLDAALAAWALEEGMAELTALVADEHERTGALDLNGLARRLRPDVVFHEPPVAEGPGEITLGDRTVTLAAGETFVFAPRASDVVIAFAYTGGLRDLLAPPLAEDLEAHLVSRWETFGHTTREVLGAAPRGSTSRLSAAFRAHAGELTPAPAGATRAGSVLAYHVAFAGGGRVDDALRLALALEDDLVLSFADGAVLWSCRFDTAANAAAFASELGKRTEAEITVRARSLTVTSGSVDPATRALVASW
jgi:hypothetical protein